MATAAIVPSDEGPAEVHGNEPLTIELPADAIKLAIKYLAHSRIHPDPRQPRKDADDELRSSIATNGIQQPITVRAIPRDMPGACVDCGRAWHTLSGLGEFIIVTGERRWRGAIGVMPMVPAVVRTDLEVTGRRLLFQLVENAKRKAVAPLDEARAFAQAMSDDASLTQSEIHRVTGIARSTIADRIALLRNAAWVPLLEAGELTSSQMVELSRYADAYPEQHEEAIRLLREIASTRHGRVADIMIAEFRNLVADAYADPDAPPRIDPVHRHAGDSLFAQDTSSHGEPEADAARSASEEATEGQAASAPDVEESIEDEDEEAQPTTDDSPESHDVGQEELPARETTPAESKGAPSRVAATPPREARTGAEAGPQGVSTGGIFAALGAVISAGPAMITVASAGRAGYRVTFIPHKSANKKPLAVEAPLASLDAAMAREVAHYVGGKVVAPPAAPKRAAPARKASAPTRAKAPARKPVAQKSTPKKSPAKKPAPKAVARPKPAAKKAARKATAFYPDAALAGVIGAGTAKLPAAVKGVLAYIKQHDCLGAGPSRGLVSCNDALRLLFGGAKIVKLNQVAKLVKPHLTTTAPDPVVDPAQLDLTS